MKDFSLVVKNLGTWSQNEPSFLYKMRYCHHSVAHTEIYRQVKKISCFAISPKEDAIVNLAQYCFLNIITAPQLIVILLYHPSFCTKYTILLSTVEYITRQSFNSHLLISPKVKVIVSLARLFFHGHYNNLLLVAV